VQALLCVIGSVLLTGNLRAATADSANPYADTIVGRNVFSLKDPPPPPKPEDLVKKDPPPTIELQGLTTILGRRQVLFKVKLPAKPGQAAKEESFVLTEGERQGEIEVLEIDENAGVVKFNNHGTVEPKNMKDHVAKAPAAPPVAMPQPGVPPPAIPALPRPTAAVNPAQPANSSVATFGGSSDRITPTRTLRTTSASLGSAPFGAYGAGQTTPASQSGRPLTPDEQVVMLEAMREANKDNPRFPPIPPTALNPNPSSGTPPTPPGLPPIPQ
jgi:hypothetical protein